MSWIRYDDHASWAPLVTRIARNLGDHQRILGALQMLMERCASHRTDGYLTDYTARVTAGRAMLVRLIDAGLVHPAGTDCSCLKWTVWPPEALYAVHGYLDSNPSRDEVDVARAKAGELRDPQLRVEVRERDRDRCRYCATPVRWNDHKSGRGGVLDHVDPAVADGAANLVVACRNCNSRKGQRTPAQAGMTLLPDPTRHPIHATDPDPIHGSDPDPTTHGRARDATRRDGTGRALGSDQVEKTSGAPRWERDRPGGDGGARGAVRVGPATTPRTSANPNPYLRAGHTGPDPANHAGIPADPDPDHPP